MLFFPCTHSVGEAGKASRVAWSEGAKTSGQDPVGGAGWPQTGPADRAVLRVLRTLLLGCGLLALIGLASPADAAQLTLQWTDNSTNEGAFRIERKQGTGGSTHKGTFTPRGLRVSSPNLAARAGLNTGDVILAVNGQSVTGFADVFRLYQDVRRNPGLTSVSVDIERQGQLMTKTYRIR